MVRAMVLGALAAAQVGCHHQVASTGAASVAVYSRLADAAAITRIQVIVTRGSGPDFAPMQADLVQSDGQWTGRISGIPAGPGRQFDAAAYGAAGQVLYSGRARVDIVANGSALVVIVLSDARPPVEYGFPIIDSVTASQSNVPPGGQVAFGVTAHDPAGDALTYRWSATCGAIADPTATSTRWTAPAAAGACQISVTVRNARGLTTTAYLSISVQVAGDTVIHVTLNQSPVIAGLVGSVLLGSPEQGDAEVAASDPDGDPLGYAWSSSSPTLVFDPQPPTGAPKARFIDPTPPHGSTSITVTVSDGRGGATTGVFTLPPPVSFQVTSCYGRPSGSACDDQDGCTTGDTCQSGVCAGAPRSCPNPGDVCSPATGACGAPGGSCLGVVCAALDQCHEVGTCQPATGTCTNPQKVDGTPCSDGNACTAVDVCGAGQCVPGAAKACAAVDACHLAGTCAPSTGACSSPPAPDGTTCSDGLACTAGDQCRAGACAGTPVACSGAAVCVEPAGTCQSTGPTAPTPFLAVDEGTTITNPTALAYDGQGFLYQAGAVVQPGIDFGGGLISSSGGQDAYVVKLDPATGRASAATWGRSFGDAQQGQAAQAVAVTGNVAGNAGQPVVGLVGGFKGSIDLGGGTGSPLTNPGALAMDFVAGLSAADGHPLWLRGVDLNAPSGSGKLFSIASNPGQTRLAVCGMVVKKLAGDLGVTSGAAGGGKDVVVAVLDAASGAVVWGRQFGGLGDEACTAVAIDDQGEVVLAGTYGKPFSFGAAALPAPTTGMQWIFVAKLDAAGAPLAASGFGRSDTIASVRALAVDALGNVAVGGQLIGSLAVGGSTLLPAEPANPTAAAFVAYVDAGLSGRWAAQLFTPNALDAGNDARAVAFDGLGQVFATGILDEGSGPTAGLAALTSAGAGDVLLVRLDPVTGAATFAASFGDASTQEAWSMVVTRLAAGGAADRLWLAGNYAGTLVFPGLAPLVAGAASRKFLLEVR
jgi:hypothetical protein